MPDEPTTTEPTTEPSGEPPKAPEGTPPVEQPKSDEVPAEVLRDKLTQANSEAANYRVKLREAQDALSKAKTVEEFESATKDLNDKIAGLERQVLIGKVAAEANLPADLASVLQGTTEDELKAHAKTLAKYAPSSEPAPPAPESLGGGLTPSQADADEGLSPRELAQKHGRKRR